MPPAKSRFPRRVFHSQPPQRDQFPANPFRASEILPAGSVSTDNFQTNFKLTLNGFCAYYHWKNILFPSAWQSVICDLAARLAFPPSWSGDDRLTDLAADEPAGPGTLAHVDI